MPPKKCNQPTSKTPILQIDAAMFQAAVTAVMAHLNANNANVSSNAIGNPDSGDDQVQPQAPTCKDTSNLKPNILKRKFENLKRSCSTQEPNRGQRTGAVNTPISPVILAPTKSYLGNLPHYSKCNYHHHGVCRELHCNRCNIKGHTARICRTPVEFITSTTDVGTIPICHLCGETGHYKRDCPTEKNYGGVGGF